MKSLILLTLTWVLSLSHGKYCEIYNKDTLHVICNPADTQPIHIINDETVRCGKEEVLRKNISTLDIATCTFDDFYLFENFTTLQFSFFHQIKSVRQETFIGMNQLEHFKVGYSNAEVLASAFSELTHLRKVDIYSNNLNMSELAFQGAHQLKSVSLSDFSMSSLPSGFFRDLNNLEYLSLEISQFTNLSAIDFTGLEKLKWLSLNLNRISNVTGNSFHILKSLKYLDISYNRLSDIGSFTFSKLHSLIHLNLEGNQIEQLNASTFSGLTNLRSLNLHNNYMYGIEDGAFSTLNNLKKLDLSNNRLTALDEHSFKGLDNLQYLCLNRNAISTINVNTFSALTKLAQLDLSSLYELETLDLNAFPQFIDLQTKTVIDTTVREEPEDFVKDELLWIKSTFSLNKHFHGDISFYEWKFFGNFTLNKSDEDHLNNLSENIANETLIFGNLDLSKNRITAINVLDKRH